jgi:ankyrin repeat protein
MKLNISLLDEYAKDSEVYITYQDYNERDILKGNYSEALHRAVTENNLEFVEFLIKNGVDIHINNDIAIRTACEKGFFEITKFLLENGANIHANDEYCIRYAAQNNHIEIVKLLYENHAQLITAKNNAMKHAIKSGNNEIIKYFLEKNKNLLKINFLEEMRIHARSVGQFDLGFFFETKINSLKLKNELNNSMLSNTSNLSNNTSNNNSKQIILQAEINEQQIYQSNFTLLAEVFPSISFQNQ